MAYTYELDTSKPAGGEERKLGDDRIRETRQAFVERLQEDHKFVQGDDASEEDIGYHKKSSYIDQADDPATYTKGGVGYTKSGDKYFRDKEGNVIRITKDGVLNVESYSDPAGIIRMWGGAIAGIPSGYLLCNGAAVSRKPMLISSLQ